MDLLDVGADSALGCDMEACGSAPAGNVAEGEEEREQEVRLSDKDRDDSASFSSSTSLLSSSPGPPAYCFRPDYIEEDKEMLSGCSKSFPGLKLFTRR